MQRTVVKSLHLSSFFCKRGGDGQLTAPQCLKPRSVRGESHATPEPHSTPPSAPPHPLPYDANASPDLSSPFTAENWPILFTSILIYFIVQINSTSCVLIQGPLSLRSLRLKGLASPEAESATRMHCSDSRGWDEAEQTD